ncbi:MAG: hypothetical protein GY889_08310 [Proteobacteria bacterium]|nr:hypothetical protein [Pseudomonadota bacterium]HJP06812.1 hypothetical protein [Arenicellales bacterium]
MNPRRWKTHQRIIRLRRRRSVDFAKYNPQMPLPFARSFRPTGFETDPRDSRQER